MNALKNAARLAAMAASASAGELDAAALPGRAWFCLLYTSDAADD